MKQGIGQGARADTGSGRSVLDVSDMRIRFRTRRTIFTALFGTGIRAGELCGLTALHFTTFSITNPVGNTPISTEEKRFIPV